MFDKSNLPRAIREMLAAMLGPNVEITQVPDGTIISGSISGLPPEIARILGGGVDVEELKRMKEEHEQQVEVARRIEEPVTLTCDEWAFLADMLEAMSTQVKVRTGAKMLDIKDKITPVLVKNMPKCFCGEVHSSPEQVKESSEHAKVRESLERMFKHEPPKEEPPASESPQAS